MKKLITSDESELQKRIKDLQNRFSILWFIEAEGKYWIDVAMSGNDNHYFATDKYIALYDGENN